MKVAGRGSTWSTTAFPWSSIAVGHRLLDFPRPVSATDGTTEQGKSGANRGKPASGLPYDDNHHIPSYPPPATAVAVSVNRTDIHVPPPAGVSMDVSAVQTSEQRALGSCPHRLVRCTRSDIRKTQGGCIVLAILEADSC